MSKHVAIAIDGPAASGKSTLARLLADELDLIMVNSGEMYRAVTWKVLEVGVDPQDAEAVVDLLEQMDFRCDVDGRHSRVWLDGKPTGDELRSEEVNGAVSMVAAIPAVREKLVSMQREFLQQGHVIMEGRDIGSVVFPDTPFKLYLDADESVRAGRRVAVGEVDSVGQRDREDSRRATAPLQVAKGAEVLDTSGHTIESGLQAALELLRKQGLKL
ncbi:MAG: (d)CMP kinase [Verrucomicrobiales bacterium]